jgi:uncharacterized protein (DUF1778 family)
MLDPHHSDTGTEKQTKTSQIRHDDALARLIDRASLALGLDKSVFLRGAIAKEATRVLEAQSSHVLNAEDAALIAAALDTPPAPTEAAKKAARSYRARVVHAD